MLFACRILLLIAKKLAVLIRGQNNSRGYTETMKNAVGATMQTFYLARFWLQTTF